MAGSEKKGDWLIYCCLFGLLSISLTAVYSATRDSFGHYYAGKQLVFAAIGLMLFFYCRRYNYRLLAKNAHIIYGIGICLLLSLYLIGKRVNGATSWIDLGVINLQPSEFTRLSTLLLLARLYEINQGECKSHLQVGFALLILLLPTLLVLLQPDLGMSLIYLSMFTCFFLLTRLSLSIHLTAAGLLLAASVCLYGLYTYAPDIFFQVVRPHQLERLTSFIHPEHDPLGSGYQYMQARKVVGSGQLGGTGLLPMLRSGVNLPEQHTDFIFAVIAQQWGFIGASSLLLLYFLLLYRLVHWAMNTPDPFASFFISGMVMMWSFQIFVNIGMNIGLTPITGLTLPFVSYGGSSLLSNLIGFALVTKMKQPPYLWEID